MFLSPLEAAGSVIGGSIPLDTVGREGSAKIKNQIIVITTYYKFISSEWRSLVISSNVEVCVTTTSEQS